MCISESASDTLLTQIVFLSLNLSSRNGTKTRALELYSLRRPFASTPVQATASDTTPIWLSLLMIFFNSLQKTALHCRHEYSISTGVSHRMRCEYDAS